MDRRTFIKNVKSWESDAIEKVLAKEPDLSKFKDQSGKTPLHYCAEINPQKTKLSVSRSIKTAGALLSAGADVNAVRVIMDEGEEFNARPLWYAVAWGNNIDLARFLLESGSDPNNCMWAAAWSQDQKVAELLFSFGADIDPVFHNETPLLQIVRSKRLKLLKWLIDNGANINFQDNRGYSPLHFAVKGGQSLTQITDLLKFGANPALKAKDRNSPISLAKEQGKIKLISLLEKYQ